MLQEKNIPKDEMKQECIKRMQLLKLDSKIINDFKNNNKIYTTTIIQKNKSVTMLDNKITEMLDLFNDKKNIKIYHVIISEGRIYILFVYDRKEEWKQEKTDLKNNWALVLEEVLENGIIKFNIRDVGIDVENGKIVRLVTWKTKSEK